MIVTLGSGQGITDNLWGYLDMFPAHGTVSYYLILYRRYGENGRVQSRLRYLSAAFAPWLMLRVIGGNGKWDNRQGETIPRHS
jgi:hypothetical protein